jgi:hypothetical protein
MILYFLLVSLSFVISCLLNVRVFVKAKLAENRTKFKVL